MAWAKLDDRFPEHPKVAGLSDRAFRLYVTGLAYAARYRTSGHIPAAVGRTWGFTAKHSNELVAARLWEAATDGHVIHDFLVYNPKGGPVAPEVSEMRAEAGRKGGASPKQTASKFASTDYESPEAKRKQNGSKTEANLARVQERAGGAVPVPLPGSSPPAIAVVEDLRDGHAECSDVGFRDRYGTLVTAFGGSVDRRMADEFEQIAEDHSLEAIVEAIRLVRDTNKRCYPSEVRRFLPRLHSGPTELPDGVIPGSQGRMPDAAAMRRQRLEAAGGGA